jgi:fatty acid desaturase
MVAVAATIFGRNETAALRRRSRWRAIGMIGHAWAIIGVAMAAFALWPNPLTLIAASVVIGARQLGLAILMHDTAHGLLWSDPKWNDRLGQWLCAFPVFADVRPYRHYHLKHHRFTQQAEDPDLVLSAPFPITKASFRRKMLRDLTGRTAFQQRRSQVMAALGPRDWPWRKRLDNFRDKLGGPLLANAVLFAGLALTGYWYLYPLLWLLPLVTWYQVAVRVRNIAEHAMVPDNDDPLRNTRTTRAGPLARLLLAPYFVNYHLEHHLLTSVPCYRLPAMHRLLAAKGVMEDCEIQRGYGAVLRLATSRQVEATTRAPRTHGRTFHG